MDANKLRRKLKQSGLSDRIIEAVWPDWWSAEANKSVSARTELCFAVARKLGLSPTSLLDERVEFVWRDRARFKHVTAETAAEQGALGSFGVSVGRYLLSMMSAEPPLLIAAADLRELILGGGGYVDLTSLLSTCWALGVPVIHLRIFPLRAKSMHAMIVRIDGRYAILLGKDSNYPAPAAFTLAHEIGHLMLGHLSDGAAIVDLDDPGKEPQNGDAEELSADEYALTTLTGSPQPVITVQGDGFGARSLAAAVLEAGPAVRVEPGTLALCFAYQTRDWPTGMASLRHIYQEPKPVWKEVNQIANTQLNWSAVSDDTADYLRIVMGLGDA
jgi:hypothetical protein